MYFPIEKWSIFSASRLLILIQGSDAQRPQKTTPDAAAAGVGRGGGFFF